MKSYYYLRSGRIHKKKYYIDYAIDLTAEEDRQIKTEIANSPNDKKLIIRKYWKKLLADGIESYNFTEALDEKCSKKRREMEKLGL